MTVRVSYSFFLPPTMPLSRKAAPRPDAPKAPLDYPVAAPRLPRRCAMVPHDPRTNLPIDADPSTPGYRPFPRFFPGTSLINPLPHFPYDGYTEISDNDIDSAASSSSSQSGSSESEDAEADSGSESVSDTPGKAAPCSPSLYLLIDAHT